MPSPLEGVKLSLIQSIDDLMEMKRWAGERRDGPLCADTESSGLSPEKDTLRLIQLGDLNRGFAVPFAMWGGGAIELLNHYQGRLAFHNRPFDLRFMMIHAGFEPKWHLIDDTLTMAHLDNPMRPRGLKPLADRLVDPRASAGEQVLHDGMKKQGWTWGTVPIDYAPYWIYGAADPVLTAHVHRVLSPRISGCRQVYDLEQAASRVAAYMMLKGMRVDVAYIHEKLKVIEEFSSGARQWLEQAHDIKSPMSGLQIAAALERQGQDITWHTEQGFPEMSKDTLAWYKANPVTPEVARICEYLLAVRHMEKMAGTYLENLLKLRDSHDIVHASIWTLGARTGRMSITDPGLQTLPRDDLVVRGAFIPRPGYVFISCDYDQIEMRLAAHFSQDPGLIQAFKAADTNGTDFFSEVAGEIFGQRIEKKDKRRQMVKNMNYARIYGAGLPKMAVTAGVTAEQLKPVYDRFNTRFPGLQSMSDDIIASARQYKTERGRPGVMTPWGRFLPGESGKEYALVNYKIQSHASEILKASMIALDADGFGNAMLLPVHDEIMFEVPEADAASCARRIQEIMENRNDYSVPITCAPKIMKERWTGK
jgi:DNA polymerase I